MNLGQQENVVNEVLMQLYIERMSSMKTFSEKVRDTRKLLHLNQEQLGILVGVSKRSIAAYESDNVIPRSSTLTKLSNALNVSTDYLANENIDDPLYGLEKTEYIDEARERFGAKAAKEVEFLLERNSALFAGGDISQEAKDAYFEAVMKAYLTCKEEAKSTFGNKKKD